jgi:hypoxia-inducible factor (prolyl hydroxylase)|eukprot:Transcript_25979.p3 GENE.Transcript_25979~~Transcript_25979.p3  ORF type:complete len:165 (-),score=66.25 Transcript_25979:32-526(-)
MVTCYPGGGARYVRHCDNSCFAGKGERCNGRRLTCILYLNPEWEALHGGELRLYEPFAPKSKPAVADVAPLLDRLIIFYADYRVPHEVLPAHAERFAITLWYFDGEERARALEKDSERTAETDQGEADAIHDEIRRFEARYGPATAKKTKVASETKVDPGSTTR